MNSLPSSACSSAPRARVNTTGNVRQYARTADSIDSKTDTSAAAGARSTCAVTSSPGQHVAVGGPEDPGPAQVLHHGRALQPPVPPVVARGEARPAVQRRPVVHDGQVAGEQVVG